ncbi:MAG: Glyoxalase/bleomycin resistance protein/dioxygenase [Alphaproteobacteria bacterium]|nr:Glyoxalase/bleomycin resistance protein/dioxygenase [Alphaproteobacteria bacterium]
MQSNRPPIPALRYDDAPAAIDFLGRSLGFTPHLVYPDPQDSSLIVHAQLNVGSGMIMLGSARPGEGRQLYGWKTAKEAGGVTMTICVILADPDAHFARARDEGADIIKPPYDNQGYPGRSYEARDPEGNVWSFTSYDPWAEVSA